LTGEINIIITAFISKPPGAGQKAYKNPVRWVGKGGEGGDFSLSLAVKSRWVIPP
jgi:hypothetical protein